MLHIITFFTCIRELKFIEKKKKRNRGNPQHDISHTTHHTLDEKIWVQLE